MEIATTSAFVNQKIANAGGLAEPMSYTRATRRYAEQPKPPLEIEIPQDTLGYPIRDNPISFGEVLQGRPTTQSQVKDIQIPMTAFKTLQKIDTKCTGPKNNPVHTNLSHDMLKSASVNFVSADKPTPVPLCLPSVGKIKLTDPIVLPDIQPNVGQTIPFAPPPQAQISKDPDMVFPLIPSKLPIQHQINPRINLTIIPESFDQKIIPFSLAMPFSVAHAPPPARTVPPPGPGHLQLTTQPIISMKDNLEIARSFTTKHPVNAGATTAPSAPVIPSSNIHLQFSATPVNSTADKSWHPTEPVTVPTQPLIPMQTAMNLSRNLTTKHPVSAGASSLPSAPVIPSSNIHLQFSATPSNSTTMKSWHPTEPVTVPTQPLIPMKTAMNLSRSFTTKHPASAGSTTVPSAPVIPSSNIHLQFSATPVNSTANKSWHPTEPVTVPTQSLIPMKTAMNLSRNFTTQHPTATADPPFQQPSLTNNQTNLQFMVPSQTKSIPPKQAPIAIRSTSARQFTIPAHVKQINPSPPVPNFSMTTLKPDKFLIR